MENIVKRFGGLVAVNDCTLDLPEGRITAIIGPNGAGKSTLFDIIAGGHRPTSGKVLFDGADVTSLAAFERYRLGLLRTFQIAREFRRLTVEENLLAAAADQAGERLLTSILQPSLIAREEERFRERAREVMAFLKIDHVGGELAGNLSGGQKKLVELGRTLMGNARMVLLDEIGAGVNPTLKREIADHIRVLNRERGMTFAIIEHDMDFIASLSDRVIVMAEGRVLTEGTMEEVRANREVIDAYFGSSK